MMPLDWETVGLFVSITLLAISTLEARADTSRPQVSYETTILHGHLFVSWTIDKDILQSNLPINYSINYCPAQLNQGFDPCQNVTTICSAAYSYTGTTQIGTIQSYPDNILKYLTNSSFGKIHDTIEKKGPFVEGSWDQDVKRFTCRIFLNRCMDGQLNPYFLYKTSFNGTTKPSYPGHVNLGDGPASKAENITILPAIKDGCCSFNLTITWQIIHVCRVDEPAFKIWLTPNGTSVTEPITEKFVGEKKYSFKYTFRGLLPSRNYTVHIESFKTTTDDKTYATKSFGTPKIRRVHLKTIKTADSGFLKVTWPVDKLFLNRSLPVVLTINWCTPDGRRRPYSCNKTKPICTATYDPSLATHGHVVSYEQNILQYARYLNIANDTSRVNGRSLATGTWDDVEKSFTCWMYLNIYLNTCSERSFHEGLKYDIRFSGASLKGQYDRVDHVDLRLGFAHYPEVINVTTRPSLADANSIDLIVKWRYRRECSTDPGHRVAIWITSNKKRQFNKKALNYNQYYSWTEQYVTYRETYKGLHPFTLYQVHITTILKSSKKIRSEGKHFWTPEGVPVASPSIEPIVDGTSTCVDDKRNVTVRWKNPPKEQTNGIIRSIVFAYWNTDHEDDRKELILHNVTSTHLIGLKCFADYQVQLRACLKGNQSCSAYSEAEEIKSVEIIKSKRRNIGYIFLWTSIGVAVGFILLALLACQYYYRKKRRKPLAIITEDSLNSYTVPYEVELAAQGDYHKLHENDELL